MVAASEAFRVIRRPNVVESIIETFTQGLLNGELRPGQRLPSEGELARQLGVGRSAVREAIKMLAAQGVVTVQQGDGTYIVDKPSSSLLSPLIFAILLESGMSVDMLELRSMIQVGYCQLAAEKATEADWDSILRAAQAWEDYARNPTRDPDELTRLDLAFHYALLDATHNPLVIRLGRVVEELFFASIRSTISQVEGLEWGIEGHRHILEAMRSQDMDAIRRVVIASLGYWGKEMRQREK